MGIILTELENWGLRSETGVFEFKCNYNTLQLNS